MIWILGFTAYPMRLYRMGGFGLDMALDIRFTPWNIGPCVYDLAMHILVSILF